MMATSSGTKGEEKLSATAERFCRRFSLAEIRSATEDFSEEHLIGEGGFGNVYRGQIDNRQQTVAIKRVSPNSNQGEGEFLTEIETLSKLRHVNVVSLIGYCDENEEMILVYEYIPGGTLADHRSSLTWKQRLNICIGAGRGLDYLHTGTSIIHRDVKSTNILLGENFIAKVSDFGLAKHVSSSKSHVSTAVKGTFGYLDPSYYTTYRLTRQSDTYAFGVVLLEVLCERPGLDRRLPEGEMNLAIWAEKKIKKGKADQIIPTNLRDEISADCLKTFVGIAMKCLNREPVKRPTMAQVVLQLECALEKQDRKASRFLPFLNRVKPSASSATGPTLKDEKRVDYVNTLSTTVPSPENVLPKAVTATSIHDWKEIKPSGSRGTGSTQKDQKQGDANMLLVNVPAIPILELKDITDNFSSKSLLHYQITMGNVYRGTLKSGQVAAIKELWCETEQYKEFLEQVSIISSLKHENVAQLLGYCVDGRRQYLVYEFASNQSLYDILQGLYVSEPVVSLSWAQRVKIAVGAAKGLEYIHEKGHIHCNIRPSNILVYNDEVVKLTDFGLSTRSRAERRYGYIEYPPLFNKRASDYCAPDHMRGLSEKSDVYSFGLVLLQLLTGCKLCDFTRPIGQQDLLIWAKPKLNEDDVKQIVDARLNGDYPPKAAAKMAAVAGLCLQYELESRPHMSIVVKSIHDKSRVFHQLEHQRGRWLNRPRRLKRGKRRRSVVGHKE